MVALAEAAKETVTMQDGLQGLLANIAVTPLGRPNAENVTEEVVPLAKVVAIVATGLVEP